MEGPLAADPRDYGPLFADRGRGDCILARLSTPISNGGAKNL